MESWWILGLYDEEGKECNDEKRLLYISHSFRYGRKSEGQNSRMISKGERIGIPSHTSTENDRDRQEPP